MRYNRCLRHATPSTTSFVAVQCHQCQPPTLYFAVSGHHLRVDVQHRRQPLPTTFAVRSRRRWPLPSPCNAIGDHLRRRALPSAPAALAALPSAAVALAMMHTAVGNMQPHRRCRPRDRRAPPSTATIAAVPCTVHRQAVASTMMSPRCIAMNDHRPSRRYTPPAATAACHHICDAHCHQQQPPSTCNATGDHRRHDTAQRVSSNRRPRVPCVVFGYRRLCDDVHRRQTPAPTPPPRNHRPCDARSSTTTRRARALVAVAFTVLCATRGDSCLHRSSVTPSPLRC